MARTTQPSTLRASGRLLILTAWCITAPLTFYVAKLFRYRHLEKIPRLFHRNCCKIMGLKPIIRGDLSSVRPTLFISNHISYTDIFLLGGIAPGNFIAKSEVAGWPVLGSLARIQDTIFFERKGRHAHSQVSVMRNHMTKGGNLILFPEGTSTEGMHVEPFKSSLFSATDLESEQQALIQPVTISYTHYRDQPMSQDTREYYAWYGTTPFSSHFFAMLGMRSALVELIFHPPVKLNDFESRKSCAEYCQQLISKSLAMTLEGNESEGKINEKVNSEANTLVK